MSSLLPAYSRRLIPAAVIAAVAAFGATVLEQPTIGSAKTREWDVAAYDKCTDAARTRLWGIRPNHKGAMEPSSTDKCCTASRWGAELEWNVCRSPSVPRTTRTGSTSPDCGVATPHRTGPSGSAAADG